MEILRTRTHPSQPCFLPPLPPTFLVAVVLPSSSFEVCTCVCVEERCTTYFFHLFHSLQTNARSWAQPNSGSFPLVGPGWRGLPPPSLEPSHHHLQSWRNWVPISAESAVGNNNSRPQLVPSNASVKAPLMAFAFVQYVSYVHGRPNRRMCRSKSFNETSIIRLTRCHHMLASTNLIQHSASAPGSHGLFSVSQRSHRYLGFFGMTRHLLASCRFFFL